MKNIPSKILEVNNLTVRYQANQKLVLKNCNLEINQSDHLAIVGPSGCGKTTLAKSIVQILPEDSVCSGYLSINGIDPRRMNKDALQRFRRNTFGFIYQDSIRKLNPLMTVGDHLYELLKVHWKKKSNVLLKKILKDTFIKVGINTERLNSYPHEFSGGMRQRVCIAMALALNPKILIADEPTTSLDTLTSFEVMKELLNLCEKFGSTLILITHDVSLAAKWCKKLIIMENGSIKETGNIKEFKKLPRSNIGKSLLKASKAPIKPYLYDLAKKQMVLEVINLRHWYKLNNSFLNPQWNKVLNEINFKLFKNETLGIVGISGSGKSTLSRALTGLIDVRGGQINFYGDMSIKYKKNRFFKSKQIQMIFQDPFSSLNPKMSIKSILEDVLIIHRSKIRETIKKEIISILKSLNLPFDDYFLKSYPNQLSGGQQQRVAIAKALLVKPKILICDESVNMLDAPVKIEILQLLRSIQEKMNLTIIFITHDLSLANAFCNRILVMDHGQIVEEGDSREIFSNPKSFTASKLVNSSLNLI